jgi:hypothetical protein
MLVAAFTVVCATSCVLAPAGPEPESDRQSLSRKDEAAAAQRMLEAVIARVLRNDTGSFRAEMTFGDVKSDIEGEYSIRMSRARLQVNATRLHRDAWHSVWPSFDVILVRGKAFVRKTSTVDKPAGRWIRASKRHTFYDLPCWPSAQRHFPDRTLMLLWNADAVGFDPERPFVIVATVPASLIAGVFADPRLAEQLLREGSAPVTVQIGQFRGRLTTFELEGKAVSAALAQPGTRSARTLDRRLKNASYFVSFGDYHLPTLLHPPQTSPVSHPGPSIPLPPPPQLCRTATV